MKIYEVTVAAVGEKVFTVCAGNEKEAREKTQEIFAQTDLLDLTSDELRTFVADVTECEDEVDDDDACDDNCDECPEFYRAAAEAFSKALGGKETD